MNSIYDTRRENLRIMVNQLFAGSQAQFARALKSNAAMISRMLSGNPSCAQNMGSATARRIEQRFGLLLNSFDQPPGERLSVLPPPAK